MFNHKKTIKKELPEFNDFAIQEILDEPEMVEIQFSLLDENGVKTVLIGRQHKKSLFRWLSLIAGYLDLIHTNKDKKSSSNF